MITQRSRRHSSQVWAWKIQDQMAHTLQADKVSGTFPALQMAILSLLWVIERQTERTYMFLFSSFQLLHVAFSMIQCFSLSWDIKICLSF